MKILHINERPNVMIPDFLLKTLQKKKVKSFTITAQGKDTAITLHVNLEKVTEVSKGESHTPEAFEGVAYITVVL